MEEKNIQPVSQPPSSAQLLKTTALAVAVAAVLLVTVVMPAEYGLDPTGIGEVLGLKRMGEIKESIAHGAHPTEMAQSGSPQSASGSEAVPARRTDEMTVTLGPGEGTEIKVTLEKGKVVDYSWSSDGGNVDFDVHGDNSEIQYHGYEKGSDQAKEGTIAAAFTGNHGWFWRNRTEQTVNVKLEATGEHTSIKHLK